MERLRLQLVGPEDGAFRQYIPGNLRPLVGREDTVCVGAAYGAAACGAALAQRTGGMDTTCGTFSSTPPPGCAAWGPICSGDCWGSCGPGGPGRSGPSTPRGCWRAGGRPWASWSGRGFPRRSRCPRLLHPAGGHPGCQDHPAAGAGGMQRPGGPGGGAGPVPGPAGDRGSARLRRHGGAGPPLGGPVQLLHGGRRPVRLGSSWTAGGRGVHLACLYVLPEFRSGRTAGALIARSLRAARALLPPETEVWASAIDRGAYSLCDKLLRPGGPAAVKETELCAVYTF